MYPSAMHVDVRWTNPTRVGMRYVDSVGREMDRRRKREVVKSVNVVSIQSGHLEHLSVSATVR